MQSIIQNEKMNLKSGSVLMVCFCFFLFLFVFFFFFAFVNRAQTFFKRNLVNKNRLRVENHK